MPKKTTNAALSDYFAALAAGATRCASGDWDGGVVQLVEAEARAVDYATEEAAKNLRVAVARHLKKRKK